MYNTVCFLVVSVMGMCVCLSGNFNFSTLGNFKHSLTCPNLPFSFGRGHQPGFLLPHQILMIKSLVRACKCGHQSPPHDKTVASQHEPPYPKNPLHQNGEMQTRNARHLTRQPSVHVEDAWAGRDHHHGVSGPVEVAVHVVLVQHVQGYVERLQVCVCVGGYPARRGVVMMECFGLVWLWLCVPCAEMSTFVSCCVTGGHFQFNFTP